jgi:hypothetical protein
VVVQESIAVVRPGCLDDEARQAYAKAFDTRRDTTGGLGSMDAALDGAELFEVVLAGQIVARYALKSAQRANGCEVYVVAAAGGMPGACMVQTMEPYIAQQCQGADRLTINTRRRGLVKKMLRQGWTLDAYVMRKKL